MLTARVIPFSHYNELCGIWFHRIEYPPAQEAGEILSRVIKHKTSLSNQLRVSSPAGCTLSFWHYMKGTTVGSLTTSIIGTDGTAQELNKLSGQQGNLL